MMFISKSRLAIWSIVFPLLFVTRPTPGQSQPCCPGFHPDLLQSQQMAAQFRQMQLEYRAWRDRDRRNVPVYNARLNGAVIAFHKHITKDDHYLTTNCSLCRKHLSQIKSYSRKLDRAMK